MIAVTMRIGKEGYAFQAYLRALKTRIPRAAKFCVQEEARLLKKTMTDGIRKRAPGGKPFVPLRDSTVQRKGHNRPLVETRTLLRSFKTWKTTGDGLSVAVGIPQGLAHPRAKKTVSEIMHIHEFGRKGPWQLMRKSSFKAFTKKHPGIPARPVFGPVWDAWSPGFAERFTKRFFDLLTSEAFMTKRKVPKEYRDAQRLEFSLDSIVSYPKQPRVQYVRRKWKRSK